MKCSLTAMRLVPYSPYILSIVVVERQAREKKGGKGLGKKEKRGEGTKGFAM